MSGQFKVSVIIPVYNAEEYLEIAVDSAFTQDEVAEIILIEDYSHDNSYLVCQELAKKYDKIKIFRNSDGMNKGAGASRNLGIIYSKSDYVAFLDADDYYLPNRFKNTKKVFQQNPINVAGVYEAVGTEFVDQKSKKEFIDAKNIKPSIVNEYITFVKEIKEGKDFFYSLIYGKNGYPSTIGITIKKDIIFKAGLFNENLRLHQDSEYWIRLAYYGYFKSTSSPYDVVSVRRVHSKNRFTKRDHLSKYLYFSELYHWVRNERDMDRQVIKFIRYKNLEFRIYKLLRIKNGIISALFKVLHKLDL